MIKEAEKYLNADQATKFRLMDYYNNNCYPYVNPKRKYKIQRFDNWCAMFTTVIASRCGLGSDRFPYEVSVFYQVQAAKEMGTFYTDRSKIKPNDLIVYDWKGDGVLDHVGIVVSSGIESIRVIEGNKNDSVGYRIVPLNSPAVVGFISTGYSSPQADLVTREPTEDERIGKLAKETIQGRYGNGNERKQALGKDYDRVQTWITNYWQ